MPFGITGCSGEFLLFAGGKSYVGSAFDLSGFGVSGNTPIDVEVIIDGKELIVRNGGEEAFVETMAKPFGKFIGVRWRYEGIGDVLSLEVKPQ